MIEQPADNNNMISNEPENVLRVNNNNNQQNPNSQSSRNPELPQSGRYQSNRNQDQVQRRSNVVEFMKPNSHFMFQTMIDFHRLLTLFYFLAEIVLFVYKDNKLHYPPHSISVEIVCLIFFLIVQLVRFYLGALGNRSETSIFVLFCLIFVIVPLYTYVQFLILQTYVLKLEVILNAFGLCITGIETAFCLLSMMAISKQEKTM